MNRKLCVKYKRLDDTTMEKSIIVFGLKLGSNIYLV